MTTTTEKKIEIKLSEGRPVRIAASEWPVIARASDFWGGSGHECQANEEAWIKVRQHADGRTLVYGLRDRGPGGMPLGYRARSAGYLVRAEGADAEHVGDASEIIRAIRRVAGVIGWEAGAAECIGDLPAEEL